MLRKIVFVGLALGSMLAHAAVDEVALKAMEQPTPATVQGVGNATSFVTNITGAAEWNRPFADGTCCSGLGPVRYTVQVFTLSANDTCDINSVQDGFDGYIFIYQNAFDPLNQTANFVAGDDDGNGGIGTSDIMGLPLQANTNYFFVSTAFENGEEGEMTNTITCPTATVSLSSTAGIAQAVPANNPWTLALLAAMAALAGAFALVKRHR